MSVKAKILGILAKRESGQAMLEYTSLLAMFVTIAVLMLFLLSMFMEYGWRMMALVNTEFN